MSKFQDDTKLCHGAKKPDDITELHEDINKLVEWANQGKINFNADKCSVMHISSNNLQDNYYLYTINSCDNRSAAGSRNHHRQRPQVAKTNREKLQNGQQSTNKQTNNNDLLEKYGGTKNCIYKD